MYKIERRERCYHNRKRKICICNTIERGRKIYIRKRKKDIH